MFLVFQKKLDGKRIYDKRQYCHFCETSVTKYVRLLSRHSSVAEVPKALSDKKGHLRPCLMQQCARVANGLSLQRSGLEHKVQRTNICTIATALGLSARKLFWKNLRSCNKRPSDEEAKKRFSKTLIKSMRDRYFKNLSSNQGF